jgi:L-lactate dehydrogenase complex protein LldE
MKIGLFIPCYVDAFFPEVGIATLELLERFGCSIQYPLNQTCCGQPMANSGCQEDSAATEALFVKCFKDFDTIVGPSGTAFITFGAIWMRCRKRRTLRRFGPGLVN